MSKLSLTLACADYDRIMPLATGAVAPDGIDLTMILGEGGSWARRTELLGSVIADPSVDGGEGSIGAHIRRIDAGDRSFVALPVFPLRGFSARDIYVHRDGPVRTPADLAGCRFGMYSWFASGSIWYRDYLRFLGVPMETLRWHIGDIERPGEVAPGGPLPEGVTAAPQGRFLAAMLADRELDAMFSPPRPQAYDPVNGPIVRLFPNFRAAELAYYRDSGIYPPVHLVIVRRAVWEVNKWIGRSLTDAFGRAGATFQAALRNFPYATPWVEAELDETVALMGEDFYPNGFEANRAALDVFCAEALRAGLVSRRLTPEELFAEFLGA